MLGKQLGAVRSVFWFLGLAAMAVALALLVGRNGATATLFWPPYRFDVSFNLLLFVLIAGFVLVYSALRALSVLRSLPAQAQRWRSQQVERAVVGSIMDALSHQIAGRFVRAQSSAQHALEQMATPITLTWPRREQWLVLANLLVAESAQSLQDHDRRDRHLEAALDPLLARNAPEAREGALLRAARWAVEDRDTRSARRRLAELPQGAARRIQALRLRLQIARMEGATQEALETARLLAKHRAFSVEGSISLLRGLALDALRQAHDLAQLQKVWAGLDATERVMPEIAVAATRRLLVLGVRRPDASPAEQSQVAVLAGQWLEPVWARFPALDAGQQQRLVAVLEAALPWLDGPWLARVEQMQRQLPDNANLQYLAGQACMQRQLWGKAAQLLALASHSLRDADLLRSTWCSLARLAEERGDEAAAQVAWKQAALMH